MREETRRNLVIGVAAVAVLLGVGFATYLLGGDGGGAGGSAAGVARIDPVGTPTVSYVPTEALRLRWGRGPKDVWVDERWFGSTMESFSVDDAGRFLVADHPKWHVGARVRRFAPDGTLQATWLTPSGSLYFEPFGTGIMFVTARGVDGVDGVEHVHLYSEDGSVKASFPVQAGVNSTSLFRTEDLLAVTTEVPELGSDPTRMKVEGQSFPVVLLTPSGPQTAPVQQPMTGIGADTSGRLYERALHSDRWAVYAGATQTITLADRRSVRIPGMAKPLGVDGDLVWMMMPPAVAPDDRIDDPAWPWGTSNEAEVLAGRVNGTYVARIVVPWSPLLRDVKRRIAVTRDALWVLDADPDGIRVLRYQAVAR